VACGVTEISQNQIVKPIMMKFEIFNRIFKFLCISFTVKVKEPMHILNFVAHSFFVFFFWLKCLCHSVLLFVSFLSSCMFMILT
jgi:hypothetical protein